MKRMLLLSNLMLIGLVIVSGGMLAVRSFALSSNESIAAGSPGSVAQAVQVASASSTATTQSGPDPIIAAAGEIGQAGGVQAQTAQLILTDHNISNVVALGDLNEGTGTQSDFLSYWSPNWGKLNSIILPTPGSHDYMSNSPYYYQLFQHKYAKWWSTNIGSWHVVSLNSQEDHASSSMQNTWLRQDLAANRSVCTLAFDNYPRFSSGSDFGSDTSMQPLWQTLYNSGADVVLSAESHHYERFNAMDPSGNLDIAKGITSFVVGTGGATLNPANRLEKNSAFKDAESNGVLKLTLHKSSYDWSYETVSGAVLDSGTGNCH